jgi:DNA-directed RNA polymerase specialized sigma24 family protein
LDLAPLPEDENAIELADCAGPSQREISERADLPLGTVKSRRLKRSCYKSNTDSM